VPRANRTYCGGRVWHITHRCHEKNLLLKFSRDRRRWRHWLFVACRRYGLSVLNYIATSNHVHLLVADRGRGEIAPSMQLVAGRTAQEFNARKCRRGAFWEDRYHATAVQTDMHLLRCITYIDLNMVRAGVVAHPGEWDVSGYSEIQRPWQRKGVIDFGRLGPLLGVTCHGELAALQEAQVSAQIGLTVRDPSWTEAVAVGDEAYVNLLRRDLRVSSTGVREIGISTNWLPTR